MLATPLATAVRFRSKGYALGKAFGLKICWHQDELHLMKKKKKKISHFHQKQCKHERLKTMQYL